MTNLRAPMRVHIDRLVVDAGECGTRDVAALERAIGQALQRLVAGGRPTGTRVESKLQALANRIAAELFQGMRWP